MSQLMAIDEKTETDEGRITYEDAASLLGVQIATIKQLAYREVLHPIKVSGSQHKFLLRVEVDWYDRRRRRQAVNEPNPIMVELRRQQQELWQQQAAVELQALKPGEQAMEQVLQPDVGSQLSDVSGLGGLAMLFLVFALLLAFMANKMPDPQKLEELRTAPGWQPVRRAILKLAGEIAA